jgi:hypothetical protein
MTTDLSFRDFSLTPEDAKPKSFNVDGDVFFLPGVIAPVVLGELIESAKGLGGFHVGNKAEIEAALERIAAMTDLLLSPETAPRFRERLFSRTEPLDLNKQVVPIVRWIVEVYSVRPTEASSDSMNGSEGAGGISTDIAPIVESIPGVSPLFVS